MKKENSGSRELLPLETSLGYQIRTTHRLFQSYLQSKIEPHGVTLGMWYFLRVLWKNDGLTQRELSRHVGTMEPTTLIALRSMEKAGFIRRQRNAEDARKVNIFLTEEGRSLKKKLLPLARQVVDDAATGFSQEDRETLLGFLLSIQKNISEKYG